MKTFLSFVFLIVGLFCFESSFAQEGMLFLHGQDMAKYQTKGKVLVKEGRYNPDLFMMVTPYQQNSLDNNNPDNENGEKDNSSEPKPDTQTASTAPTQLPPASKVVTSQVKPVVVQEETMEEDVLSFNFLYMLIQKFKVSEILD